MRIDSSAVGMESGRSYRASNTGFTRFTMREYRGGLTGGNNALNTQIGNDTNSEGGKANQSSQRGLTTLEDLQARFQRFNGRLTFSTNTRTTPSQTFATIQSQTINYILDLFFGRGVRNSWSMNGSYYSESYQSSFSMNTSMMQPNPFQWQFFQGNYQYESESTYFTTQGTVRTSDGREINFNVNIGMSREFRQYYEEEIQGNLDLVDPLVINLNGTVADVSDQTFYFDIDGDGVLDEINQLGSGSGFLALDKNGDGVINDGSELFGTASGNGFKDLAQYDDDGDGWIDEDDAIWAMLKIWCKDKDGNDVLYSLADLGVGAICLQNVNTEFTQQGQDGSAKDVIRNTGVFLYENGNVGTVQHVDMVKHSYSA